jgi:hypothetical protein
MKNEGPLLQKGLGNCWFCKEKKKKKIARKKNIVIYGHRIESVRQMTRVADTTVHCTPVDCPLKDFPRQIYYRQKESTLNKMADVQNSSDYIQIAQRVLKYLFTE